MLATLINALINPNYLTLENIGYSSVPPEFFKDSYLKDIGIIKSEVNSQSSYLIFKKEIEKEFNDFLFVNKTQIIHMIFIEDLMIYRKAYNSKKQTNGQQYMSIVNLLPEFNNSLAVYKEMDKKALIRIGFYANKIKNFNYADGHFMINTHRKLKDTYHLNHDGCLDEKDIKIIGDHLYQIQDTEIKPLGTHLNESGIDFENTQTFWLINVEDEYQQKESLMEVNFNNKAFYYIKACQYDPDNPKTNMIVFKNIADADLSKFSFSRIMHDNKRFEKIIMIEATDIVTKFVLYAMIRKYFMENDKIRKWWLSELCKNFVSIKTREELGLTLEGPLSGDELMIVEALFI